MAQLWFWIPASASVGLMATGLWLKTLEHDPVAITAAAPPPVAPAAAPLAAPDWDGSSEGTLNAAQQSSFAAFHALEDKGYIAFAISAGGAAGLGTGLNPDIAEADALTRCQQMQGKLHPAGTSAQDCTVIAIRMSDR